MPRSVQARSNCRRKLIWRTEQVKTHDNQSAGASKSGCGNNSCAAECARAARPNSLPFGRAYKLQHFDAHLAPPWLSAARFIRTSEARGKLAVSGSKRATWGSMEQVPESLHNESAKVYTFKSVILLPSSRS